MKSPPDIEVLPSEADPRGSLKRLATLLDAWILIPGTNIRVGLDSLIGLIPGFGDAIGAMLGSYIVVMAARAGAPRRVLVRMIANLTLETVIGVVPIIGDLFDVVWRANLRNMALLDQAVLVSVASGEGERRLIETLLFLVVMLVVLIVITIGVGVLGLRLII